MDLTLIVKIPVMLKLVCLKVIWLEPWLVQYPVQLYDTGRDVTTSHLNLIHIAAGYGGVGGSVVMFTCRTTYSENFIISCKLAGFASFTTYSYLLCKPFN